MTHLTNVPTNQKVSVALLVLVMLVDIAFIVLGIRQGLGYTPWLTLGQMAIVTGAAGLGSALFYLAHDWFAKYVLSMTKNTGAYEATRFNLSRAFAYKSTLLMAVRLVIFVAFLVLSLKYGQDTKAPTVCVPGTCMLFNRSRELATQMVRSSLISLLFGAYIMQIYFSRDHAIYVAYMATKSRAGATRTVG